ncbi:MAG: hypothetical protein V2A79_03375 [Planctomycetota bacterium]
MTTRCRFIGLVVSLLVMVGCDAQRSGASGGTPHGAGNENSTDGTGPWFDGNGNSVDQTPDVYSEVDHFTLVATTVGAGSVEPAAGTYESGEEVSLVATADPGWRFDHWEGDAAGTDPTVTIAVIGDTVVVAWFANIPVPDDNSNNNDNEDGEESIVTVDPGDSFASAPLVDLGSDGKAILDQTLAQASDVHVYDVGPLALGDRLTATCEARPGSQLDPMVALFDADGYRVFWNDDLNMAQGEYDAVVSGVIHHDSTHHYLAVTSTDYTETSGAYRLTVEVERGAGLPQIAGQTIVIDFDGAADVVVAGQSWGTFAAFDAAAIDPMFAGQTDALKGMILAVVRADYAPYAATVLSTDDPMPPAPYTIAFLGGDSETLFGIADGIDFYNGNHQDNVVVFAGAFGGLSGALEAIGQALGNVVSHEVGHDLGLMHTTDVTEVMDTTGMAITLLVDQHFGAAAVYDFPIGFQNAPLLLEETLGLAARPRVLVQDGYLRCGTCGARLYKVSDPSAGR